MIGFLYVIKRNILFRYREIGGDIAGIQQGESQGRVPSIIQQKTIRTRIVI